jgi:hypothetical protein
VNPLDKIPAVKLSAELRFQIVEITPVLAAEWLKRNRKNRKLKDLTVETYARDMRNDAWYLTHQGVAFDAEGFLLDGQHRLQAIVSAKKNVPMFVTAGWPVGGKKKTMDAVDRGVNRSLADQLHLQHGIAVKDAARVVQVANAIAAACNGAARVRKSSTHCILAVLDLYPQEIKFVLDHPIKTNGLKSATVGAIVAMARAIWPDQTSDFLTRLVTGENLTRDNPILHLRNYLMSDGANADKAFQCCAITHHLLAFVEKRPLNSLVCTSNAALLQLLKLSGDRVEKIRKVYGAVQVAAPAGRPVPAEPEADNNILATPTSATGIKIGHSLRDPFSLLDLSARLDGNGNQRAGQWLMTWRNKDWIDSVGTNNWRKTDKFGK